MFKFMVIVFVVLALVSSVSNALLGENILDRLFTEERRVVDQAFVTDDTYHYISYDENGNIECEYWVSNINDDFLKEMGFNY